MNWEQLPPLFTTNVTKSGKKWSHGAITREFVTSGYFGGLPGDPDSDGSTRVVTQNNAGPTFWVGKQSPGKPFDAFWDKVGAVGHYDYGSLTMARTLGGDPNQVVQRKPNPNTNTNPDPNPDPNPTPHLMSPPGRHERTEGSCRLDWRRHQMRVRVRVRRVLVGWIGGIPGSVSIHETEEY